MPDNPSTAPDAEFTRSLDRLKQASDDLRARIEEEKKRQDMPLDSNLGDPEWEEKAKDGRFDRADDDDE